ncbi:hypothetical protein [Streptomyces sp. NPDC004296]|uniref:hypothetical protein n=1 Tax=Streptomyces sp. NPDC004296 TaxID=3364697 RepID=UPI0036C05A9F
MWPKAPPDKGYGLVRGEVQILDGLPEEYAQGIYAVPGRHDAVLRFSNGSPHAGADARLGRATGLGLKMFDVDGPTLLDDEPDTRTFDYNTINAPVFFCNTLRHYLFIQELFLDANAYMAEGTRGRHRFYRDYVTGKGTLAEDRQRISLAASAPRAPSGGVARRSRWPAGCPHARLRRARRWSRR